MKVKSYLNGFTLFELIVGLFFSTLAALSIIIGSVHAKKVVNDPRARLDKVCCQPWFERGGRLVYYTMD